VAVRQRTNAGPVVIAAITGRPASTIGKVLRRQGCSRLPRPERDPSVTRCAAIARARSGELLHVDTKKLGQFHVVGKRILRDGVARGPHVGWQHLHIAIDDHSRLAYAEVLAGVAVSDRGADRVGDAAGAGRGGLWRESGDGVSVVGSLSAGVGRRLGIARRRRGASHGGCRLRPKRLFGGTASCRSSAARRATNSSAPS
jgi:hypothetical protein